MIQKLPLSQCLERTVYKTKLGNDLFEVIIKKENQQFHLIRSSLYFILYNYTADLTRKNTPNQADNIMIFRSCLLPKMRLSVVFKGGYIGYECQQNWQFFKPTDPVLLLK